MLNKPWNEIHLIEKVQKVKQLLKYREIDTLMKFFQK
jgi:hypothetical protein